MDREKMNETMMEQVNGGKNSNYFNSKTILGYEGHKECGGEIKERSDGAYICSKCGEVHKNKFDFRIETIWY